MKNMTLQQCNHVVPFMKAFLEPTNKKQSQVGLDIAEGLDKERKAEYMKRKEGGIFDMAQKIAPRLGLVGAPIPVTDSNGRMYLIGNTQNGDRTVIEIDADKVKKFLDWEMEKSRHPGMKSFEDMNGIIYETLGSKPSAGYQPLDPFYPTKKRGKFVPIPGSWDYVAPNVDDESTLPDINKIGLSLGDLTGKMSQNISPFAPGLRALMPYEEPPKNFLQKKHIISDLEEMVPDITLGDKETTPEPPADTKSMGFIPRVEETAYDLDGAYALMAQNPNVKLDLGKHELYDDKTGEVIGTLAFKYSRQRKTAKKDDTAFTKASDMFVEMRNVRKNRNKVVTDDAGNVDIVKSSTSSLFKSRMRGSR